MAGMLQVEALLQSGISAKAKQAVLVGLGILASVSTASPAMAAIVDTIPSVLGQVRLPTYPK